MWIGKKVASAKAQTTNAKMGTVTVGGTSPAVSTDGEQRQLQVASPGGFWWRPSSEDAVLLVEGAVVGCVATCPVSLASGEIYLRGNGNSIYFKSDGNIEISANKLYINGIEWEV